MVRRAPSFRQVPGADVAERPPNTVEEELCRSDTIQGINRLRGPTPLPPRPRLHQQMVPFSPAVEVEDRRRTTCQSVAPHTVNFPQVRPRVAVRHQRIVIYRMHRLKQFRVVVQLEAREAPLQIQFGGQFLIIKFVKIFTGGTSADGPEKFRSYGSFAGPTP